MSQQLVMTPQLQQAIKLLQLSRVELGDLVRDELLENPLLEEDREIGSSSEEQVSSVEMQDSVDFQGETAAKVESTEAGDSLDAPQPEVKAEASKDDDFDWQSYLQQQSLSGQLPGSGIRGDDDLPGIDQTATRPETLVEHLLWQIRMSNFSQEDDSIAEYIIQNISTSGYLGAVSVTQIARNTGYSVLRIEQVLRKVQQLDPLAIASRNLAESLWIQAHFPDDPIMDPLVLSIIAKYLPQLEQRGYPTIARETGEPLEEVYEATKVVLGLEPRPARNFFVIEDAQYVTPDVYVNKIGEEYIVTLNDDGLPRLKVSNLYRNTLLSGPSESGKSSGKASGKTSGTQSESGRETKDYITERLRSAQWLIRSIQQRQRTILKVTKSILKFQFDFFEKGSQHLRPLILKDVAEDIEMHESTVSRVTTNKYVHTPQGTFELKYFFNAGISRQNGSELASEAVKQKIRKLIEGEDPKRPYSDQKLVELLCGEGINIARRTVAKYREQLNVLSSSKRKKLF